MQLLNVISEAWDWTGIRPRAVVGQNAFGNLLVEDEDAAYWRICPEELTCSVVAPGSAVFQRLQKDQDFQDDWQMARLTDDATESLGAPASGRCFCLKMPAVLGGAYTLDNVGQTGIEELIAFSGDLAQQIKDLPDGAKVRLKLVD